MNSNTAKAVAAGAIVVVAVVLLIVLKGNDSSDPSTTKGVTTIVIKNGALLPTPFIELTVRGHGGAANEEGLVGITLDPSFATNNFLYVYFTVPGSGNVPSHNRVSRFTANGDFVVPGSE